jgi:molybdopterin-guanine dinucleotide biosynthesis protein A
VAASGVVLAGGRSRRMGTDKALLVVDGQRLVDRSVARLQAVADDVVVASGRRHISGLAVPQVADRLRAPGPLAGLVAGLGAAAHPVVHVLACDLLHADPVLLAALAARWRGEAAVVPSADGHPQPLHAVWSTAAAPRLATLAEGGVRSVVLAAERLGATVLDETASAALAGDPRWARNANRPEDLAGDGGVSGPAGRA